MRRLLPLSPATAQAQMANTETSQARPSSPSKSPRSCGGTVSDGDAGRATAPGRRPDEASAADFLDVYALCCGETLGRGAFSEVRRCFHRQTGRVFAVKIMRIAGHRTGPAALATTTARSRSGRMPQDAISSSREDVLQELGAYPLLEGCPGVVRLHQFFEDIDPGTGEGYIYAVFEMMRGGNLAEAVAARGSLPEDDCRSVMKSVFATCIGMRRQGLVHRDIKLDNILLQHESVFDKGLKLGDMGLAATVSGDGLLHEVCGTPAFMAPEMLQFEVETGSDRHDDPLTSKGYGAEVDMWSCGVCLWIMLCGFPPFEGNTLRELFGKIGAARVDLSDPAWEMATPEAKDLVQRCLTRDPKARIAPEQALQHPWMMGV